MSEDAGMTMPTRKGGAEVGSGRLGAWLTVLLAVPVLGFFSFAAFSPASLRTPVVPGQTMTIWYLYGLGLIAYSLILGLIYVMVTNRAARPGRPRRQPGVAGRLPGHARRRPGPRRDRPNRPASTSRPWRCS